MSDKPAATAQARNSRLKLIALAVLVIAMTLTVAGSLWLVQKKARQLALPTLHSELWQAYQIHMAMDRLLLASQDLLKGKLAPDDLVVRVQVLRSLTQPLEGQHLFDFLPNHARRRRAPCSASSASAANGMSRRNGAMQPLPGKSPSRPPRACRGYKSRCTR